MKKLLLLALFALTFNSFLYSQSYQKSLEVYGGPAIDKYSKFSFGLSMNNGCSIKNQFFFGLGVGFRYTNAYYYGSYSSSTHSATSSYDGKFLIPIYGRLSVSLTKTKIKPVLSCDLGYTIDVGQNPNKNTEGFFYEPEIGVVIDLEEKTSIYFLVGLNNQKTHYDYYSITSYNPGVERVDGITSTLTFRVGMNF